MISFLLQFQLLDILLNTFAGARRTNLQKCKTKPTRRETILEVKTIYQKRTLARTTTENAESIQLVQFSEHIESR